MAIHVTLIGPNVNSKKGDDDGKGGDNGVWQKDHQATSTISGSSAPTGAGMSASWTKLDLGQMNFDSGQVSDAREIIIWGDSVNDAISELCYTQEYADKTEYYGDWRYPRSEWYTNYTRENAPLINYGPIGGNTRLKSITFYVPVYKIGDRLFQNWNRSSNLSISFVGGFIEVGERAFYNCTKNLEISVLEPTLDVATWVSIGARADYYDEMPPEWIQWIGQVLYAVVRTVAIVTVAITAAATALALVGGVGALIGTIVGGSTGPSGAVTGATITATASSLLVLSTCATYACAQLGDTWTGACAGVKKSHYKFTIDDGKDYDYYVIDKQIQIGNKHKWWNSELYSITIGPYAFTKCTNATVKDLLFGNGEYSPGKNNEAMANYASAAYMTKESPARNNSFTSHGFSLATIDEFWHWHGREWAWAASQWNSQAPVMDEDTQMKMLAVINWSPKDSSYQGILQKLVSHIGARAFYDCPIVPEVLYLRASVDQYAFAYDDTIYSVIFVDGSNLTIANNAFYGCSNLRNLNMNKRVGYIGESAFDCTDIITTQYLINYMKTHEQEILKNNYEEYGRLMGQRGGWFYHNIQDDLALGKFDQDGIDFIVKYGGCGREYILNMAYWRYWDLISLAEEKTGITVPEDEKNTYVLDMMKRRGFDGYLQILIMEELIKDDNFWNSEYSKQDRYWIEYEDLGEDDDLPNRLDILLLWMKGEYYSDVALIGKKTEYLSKIYGEIFGYNPDDLTSIMSNSTITQFIEEGGMLKWQDTDFIRWLCGELKTNEEKNMALSMWKKDNGGIYSMALEMQRRQFIITALTTSFGERVAHTQNTYGLGLNPKNDQHVQWIVDNFSKSDYFYKFLTIQHFIVHPECRDKFKQLPTMWGYTSASLQDIVLWKFTDLENWINVYSTDAIEFRIPLPELMDLTKVREVARKGFNGVGKLGQVIFVDSEGVGSITEIGDNAFATYSYLRPSHERFYGIAGALEFPASFQYLGDGAFATNGFLTEVKFNSKVIACASTDSNENTDSTAFSNHWPHIPPFRNCPITHWTLWADNLEPVYCTEKDCKNNYTYIYCYSSDDCESTKCTHLVINGNGLSLSKLSDKARFPKTTQELYLDVSVGFNKDVFKLTKELTKVYFKDKTIWGNSWGASEPITTATALPFYNRGLAEQNDGEYYVDNIALFDYEDFKADYFVNDMLYSSFSSFKDELTPEAFYGAKPFYTLRYMRDAGSIPKLNYITLDKNIDIKWPCVDFEVVSTYYEKPLSENSLALGLLVGDKSLGNYFMRERLEKIRINRLPTVTACNTTLPCLFKGLINEFKVLDSSPFDCGPIKLYLPSDLGFIQQGAIGKKMNLLMFSLDEPDELHPFDKLVYCNDTEFYLNTTNTRTYDLTVPEDYQVLKEGLDFGDLWNDYDAKMRDQAKLTYFNNGKYNLLLKWESVPAATYVATTYLTPKIKVVAKEALELKYVVVPSSRVDGYRLVINGQECNDCNNEPIYIKNNIEDIVITFDFAFIGASVQAQAAATKYSYLSYILSEDTKKYYIRVDGLTINIIYTQNFELKTFANADNDHRPLGGVPKINTFIFRDPPQSYIDNPDNKWTPTVQIVGPYLEDGATINNIVLLTRKLPTNLFKFETNVKHLQVLDCEFIWDDTPEASINKEEGEGWLSASAFANVETIQHFVCPKNFTKVNNSCWNKNLLITNCYYYAPLYYWGFELIFPTYLENPIDRIVNFYSLEEGDTIEGRENPKHGYSLNTIDWTVTTEQLFARCDNPAQYQIRMVDKALKRNQPQLDYTLLRLYSGENSININNSAYYGNWFINSVKFDNRIGMIGAKAFDNARALREIFAQDKQELFRLYSNGLSKSYFANVINPSIDEATKQEKEF